ncbi:MAG: O-antigen ligase family protein [Saprospiraceae bacterium]|nr:O-antigen ligase family protein [Saprospiraceae bacterium]
MRKAFVGSLKYLFTSLEGQLLGLFSIMLISLVYSMEFLTSQAMFFLAAVVLFENKKEAKGFGLRKGNWQRLKAHKLTSPFWLITISFFLVLISLLWSENLKVGFRWIQLKIPFIVFPLLFMMLHRIEKGLLHKLFYFLLILMTVTCIPVLINYLMNYESFNLLLSQGQHVPVPSNHIRFSMLMALSIVSGGYLFKEARMWKYRQERWFIGSMLVFLLFMIHLLSVRTGIALLYGMLMFIILAGFLKRGGLLKNLSFVILLLVGPVLAYKALPSLKSKINYSLWDYGKYKEGRAANYSDSERIISIQAGLNVYKSAPMIGVGVGDLKDQLKDYYLSKHPSLKMKLPHNQFVTVAATYGILGLLLFMISILSPVFYRKNYKDTLFLAFNLFMLGSMLFESTLDTNYGITIYLVFLLIGLKILDKNPA